MSPRATQTHEQKQKPGTSLCSTGACSGMVPGMHSASDFENTGPNCAALLLVVWYRAGLAANGPAWGLQPHCSCGVWVRAPPPARAVPKGPSTPGRSSPGISTQGWHQHQHRELAVPRCWAVCWAGHPLFWFKSAHFLDVLCQLKKDLNFTKVKHYESETRGVAGYIKMVLLCL